MTGIRGHCWVLLLRSISGIPANWAAEQPNDGFRGAGFVHGAGCRSDDQRLGSVTEEQGQSLDQWHKKVLQRECSKKKADAEVEKAQKTWTAGHKPL